MAVPSSGVLKISEIASEFQDTVPYRLSKYYRGGALVPNSSQNANVPTSGAIKLGNFYGAVRRLTATQTYSTNTTQTTLNVSALPGYVAGITDVTITVNSGVYLYSTSTANPALTITGATAGDTVTLINNGFIMGMGGLGGNNGNNNSPGTAGGPAISLGFNTIIDNTNGSAYIGGGGGGGGGRNGFAGGGGGAGGGAGGGGQFSAGGAGGAPGQSGGGGGGTAGYFGGGGGAGGGGAAGDTSGFFVGSAAGGGGRIFPGVGGAGGTQAANGRGGAGGSANNPGVSGAGGGGGGWGASGGTGGGGAASPPGAGGRAVALNGNTVTWVAGNTTRVYGAVS